MKDNQLKQLQSTIEKIKEQKSTILVEKGMLEKQKNELKEEATKLGISINDIDSEIEKLEKEIEMKLATIVVPDMVIR